MSRTNPQPERVDNPFDHFIAWNGNTGKFSFLDENEEWQEVITMNLVVIDFDLCRVKNSYGDAQESGKIRSNWFQSSGYGTDNVIVTKEGVIEFEGTYSSIKQKVKDMPGGAKLNKALVAVWEGSLVMIEMKGQFFYEFNKAYDKWKKESKNPMTGDFMLRYAGETKEVKGARDKTSLVPVFELQAGIPAEWNPYITRLGKSYDVWKEDVLKVNGGIKTDLEREDEKLAEEFKVVDEKNEELKELEEKMGLVDEKEADGYLQGVERKKYFRNLEGMAAEFEGIGPVVQSKWKEVCQLAKGQKADQNEIQRIVENWKIWFEDLGKSVNISFIDEAIEEDLPF